MRIINVLIVEDQRSAAEALILDLEKLGYRIVGVVESGNQVLQIIESLNVDVILIDIVLKGETDGIALVEQFKADLKVPIIYLTSISDRQTLKRARRTNPSGYIIKPYKLNDLNGTIQDAIRPDESFIPNLSDITRKAKLTTYKIKTAASKTLNLSFQKNYYFERAKHSQLLPDISKPDQHIVSTLEHEGVYITSLSELRLSHTKRFIKQLILLQPHLYTLSHLSNWRMGIPSHRKFSHAEILFWGLGERLLNIVENYIGLPLLFYGVDLRRDNASESSTDSGSWSLGIDDDRMIQIIIYLNNVDENGGPFEYIPRFLTKQIVDGCNYTSGFLSEEEIAKIVPPSYWQTCVAKAGNVVITDPCNVFHRVKPSQRNRYSITFGYTSRIPKISLRQKLTKKELSGITPNLSQRQIACLGLSG